MRLSGAAILIGWNFFVSLLKRPILRVSPAGPGVGFEEYSELD